jgi:hypothetical protein
MTNKTTSNNTQTHMRFVAFFMPSAKKRENGAYQKGRYYFGRNFRVLVINVSHYPINLMVVVPGSTVFSKKKH